MVRHLRVTIISTILLFVYGASLHAQDFELRAEPSSEVRYEASLGMYVSTLTATPPATDSIWYYLNVPDSVPVAPVVTMQLNGPPSFRLLRWDDSVVSLALNVPHQIQTQKSFATSFFVAWDAHTGRDTAFLTIFDPTDTIVVRIIGSHVPPKDPPKGVFLSPLYSEWDSVTVGQIECRNYRLYNFSGDTIVVTEFGLDNPNFVIRSSPALPHLIVNEDSMDFRVCYYPQSAGHDEDTLRIMSGDSVLTIAGLIGTAKSVQIVREGLSLEATFKESDFDSVQVGTSVCGVYRLHNYTGSSVTVTNFLLEGIFSSGGPWEKRTNFHISNYPPLPHTIADKDSMSFTICYTPLFAGTDDDSLWIMWGDSVLAGTRFIGTAKAASSVGEAAYTEQVMIYPNPAQSRVYITGAPEVSSFIIVDALGREILRSIVHSNGIAIDGYGPGLYTIIFASGERVSLVIRR